MRGREGFLNYFSNTLNPQQINSKFGSNYSMFNIQLIRFVLGFPQKHATIAETPQYCQAGTPCQILTCSQSCTIYNSMLANN